MRAALGYINYNKEIQNTSELDLCNRCLVVFSSNRETNLKVRQAPSVTSDLRDVSKLMDFDGEIMQSVCIF